MGIRTGAIVLTLAALALLAVSAAADATQARRGVDGFTLGRVRHSGGGSFVEVRPGQWIEFAADGRPIAHFTEADRDAFRVTLSDASQRATVVLDLRNDEIRRLVRFHPSRTFETIIAAAPRRRDWMRGFGGRGADGLVREIEVGPIHGRGAAENICRAESDRLHGAWTGQWRANQPGGTAVCDIQFR